MNCQGNSRRIRILGIPKQENRIFLEPHDNKITFIYRMLFPSAVRGVEKMSIFPKKGLPAILNFASYIAARRGEVSELVEGARLEIVCRPETYRRFKSSSLRQKTGGFDIKSPVFSSFSFVFLTVPQMYPKLFFTQITYFSTKIFL